MSWTSVLVVEMEEKVKLVGLDNGLDMREERKKSDDLHSRFLDCTTELMSDTFSQCI